MLKQLRIKFVAITMILITVVMVVFFVAIGYSDYQRSLSTVQSAMKSAVDDSLSRAYNAGNGFDHGQGKFQSEIDAIISGDSAEPLNQNDGQATQRDNQASANSDFTAPQIGGNMKAVSDLIPLAVYTVTNGTFTVLPEKTTATISESTLATAAAYVYSAEEGAGEISEAGLHYYKRTVNQTIYIAFADSSSTDSWKSQVMQLVIAGIAMLVVFFFVVLVFSKWALKPVKDAWDAQKQFVTDASHELKTPLTVVLANTSILLKHPQMSVASQSQWVESTQIEANNMQALINEMLELAQVEDKRTLASEAFNLSEALDRCVLQFESIAFERNFTFESAIDENVVVQGDASKLNKMVSTLVENATKYVNPGGQVEVELHKVGTTATISVRNTGSFIAEEDLPHIFDRFYRTDKARTSGAGGFGLGLAIAKETALAHGGNITATSSKEDGTRFTATLPCS